MSRKITETYWSWYNPSLQLTEIRALIECDTLTDLPGINGITGYRLTIGTIAHVIDTNSLYMMQSGGAWKVQSAGTDVYTRTETDALIQSSKDYADSLIDALDVSSVGGSTRYLYQIFQTNGRITARSYDSDTTPTANSTKLIQSGGVKNYVDAETAARQAECNILANNGVKNVSKATFTSATIYGVTFTANSDGTVSANSTGTQSQNSSIQSTTFLLRSGTYIFTCSQNPQRDITYDSYVYDTDNSRTIARDNNSDAPGNTFTLAVDTNVRINLRVNRSYTANNLIFEPMIRFAEITDASYQPYSPSNRDLYEMILALQ